jgi:DNA-directed RNA polymerase specialized sigma24 family protein
MSWLSRANHAVVLKSSLSNLKTGVIREISWYSPDAVPVSTPVRTHQAQKHLNELERQRAAELYLGGATIREVATHFGCNRHTISHILKEQAIQLRREGL